MTSCEGGGGPQMSFGLFHTGIVVPEIETTMRLLAAALGVRWRPVSERPIVMDTPAGSSDIVMRYCYSEDGPHHLELIQGVDGTIWDASEGARLHHIGYGATDVGDAAAHVSDAGVPWIGGYTPTVGGPPAFTYHRSDACPLVELVTDAVRLRVTGG